MILCCAAQVSGSGILDEAILTGESTPQWKGPLTCDAGNADTRLHIKRDKGHILFSGTKLLQTQVNEETTEGTHVDDRPSPSSYRSLSLHTHAFYSCLLTPRPSLK